MGYSSLKKSRPACVVASFVLMSLFTFPDSTMSAPSEEIVCENDIQAPSPQQLQQQQQQKGFPLVGFHFHRGSTRDKIQARAWFQEIDNENNNIKNDAILGTTMWSSVREGDVRCLVDHPIRCPDESCLFGFFVTNGGQAGRVRIEYWHRKVEFEPNSEVFQSSTEMNDDGEGNMLYLDRHIVRCPPNHALVGFWLTNEGGKMKFNTYSRELKRVTNPPVVVERETDLNDDGNGHVMFLDRHVVLYESMKDSPPTPSPQQLQQQQQQPQKGFPLVGFHFHRGSTRDKIQARAWFQEIDNENNNIKNDAILGTTMWSSVREGDVRCLVDHPIRCPDESCLFGFFVTNGGQAGRVRIEYWHRKVEFEPNSEVFQSSTEMNDDGEGNMLYLDRHIVRCPPNHALVGFWLTNEGGKMKFNTYSRELKRVTNPPVVVERETDLNDDGNGHVMFLDRHVVLYESMKDSPPTPSPSSSAVLNNGLKAGYYGIKSAKFNEYLYAGVPKLDEKRRHGLTWKEYDSPENDVTMRWEIHSYGDYCGIRSVKHNEWLYAGEPKLDSQRRHALSWKGRGSPENDETMRWEIRSFGEYSGIRSVKHDEWLYVGRPKFDERRRFTLTWKGSGDPLSDGSMRWEVRSFGNYSGIRSVECDEWLYVGVPMKDEKRRFSLTWKKELCLPVNDETMRWEIRSFGDYYGIRSIKHNEWLYAGVPKLDGNRRYALTWKEEGDPENDKSMRWEIRSFGDYYGIRSVEYDEWLYVGVPKLDLERRFALTWHGSEDPSNDVDMRWQFSSY